MATVLVPGPNGGPGRFEFVEDSNGPTPASEDEYLSADMTQEWCHECMAPSTVFERREEQAGFEEQAVTYSVTDLMCGHSFEVKI